MQLEMEREGGEPMICSPCATNENLKSEPVSCIRFLKGMQEQGPCGQIYLGLDLVKEKKPSKNRGDGIVRCPVANLGQG